MNKIKAGKNLIKTNYQISRYVVQAVSNSIINRNDPLQKRKNALAITSDNSQKVLERLNVNVEYSYEDPSVKDKNFFMVCNHMSYFDIIVLSSLRPAMFVTSVEMEKTFFLGDLAKLGGSFFVDRINRRKMKKEVEALVDLLTKGLNVFIFPEGTSTNGLEILPFKKSLFRVPYQTQFPILPICLKYETINGEPFSADNCDRITWHGDMTFASHFLQLMTLKGIKATVKYLNPMDPKDFESHGDLAAAAEKVIRSAYFPN